MHLRGCDGPGYYTSTLYDIPTIPIHSGMAYYLGSQDNLEHVEAIRHSLNYELTAQASQCVSLKAKSLNLQRNICPISRKKRHKLKEFHLANKKVK